MANAQSEKECDSVISVAITKIFKEGEYGKAIQLLEGVAAIAKSQHYEKQEFLAVNNLGAEYFQMLDYGNAVKYYLDAYKIAIQNKSASDEMIVLNNIAVVYAKDEDYKKAKEYFYKSYEIAIRESYQDRVSLYASNLAKLHFEEGNLEQARFYIQETLKFPTSNPAITLNALTTQNQILLSENKYSEVIKNCDALLINPDYTYATEQKMEVREVLVMALLKNEKWERARAEIDKGLTESTNHEHKLKFYELKSLWALHTNKIQTIYATKDSIVKLKNAIYRTNNRKVLENSKLRFELEESTYQLLLNKEKANHQKRIYLVITMALMLFVIVLSWVFYKRNELLNQKKLIAEGNAEIAKLELEKQKEREKSLKLEAERSNRKLAEQVLFQSTRNELIEEVISAVSSLPQIKGDSILFQAVKNLKTHLGEDMKWEEFTSQFENLHYGFLEKLKAAHPSLNANDIRYLSFVYLDLTTNEVATLLGISPESCRKRKERIIKKLGVLEGQSLTEHLSQL